MSAPKSAALQAYEDSLAAAARATYVMTLYVAGASDRSARAISNAQRLCDTHLAGRYRLAIVDLLDDPDLVQGTGVLAVPTLVLHEPPPIRQFVGDLSQIDRMLAALGLTANESPPATKD